VIGRGLSLAATALALAALPWLVPNDFYVNLASQILVYAVWALSLNLLVGFAGMQSLGHAAYLGGGAYVCAWLVANAGLGHAGAALLTLVIVGVMAGLFGVLALRASGLGFLMITLALGQILWGVAYRWVDVTGGDNGIRLPSRPAPFGLALNQPAPFYYFALGVFAVVLLVMWRIAQSPYGAALRGTRDQPRRMSALGYNVWLIRWSAFVLAGFWGGVAGLLYVYYNKFVSPQALSLQQSAEVLIMTILGGVGSIIGPVVGAIMITLVKTVVSSYVDRWNTLLGVLFLLVIVFMPEGVVPGLRRLRRRFGR
jgi:branched-chain amino acid transport system permease protein